jgi:hypothetical protein
MPLQRKLSPDQVREIRKLANLYSYKYIANIYNVSDNVIGSIARYEIYKDVKDKDDETNRTTTQDRD